MATVKGRRKVKPYLTLPNGTRYYGRAVKDEPSIEVDFGNPITKAIEGVGRDRKRILDEKIRQSIAATETNRRRIGRGL